MYLYYVSWVNYYGEFRSEFVIATNGYDAQQFAMNKYIEQYWRCKDINIRRIDKVDGFNIKVMKED